MAYCIGDDILSLIGETNLAMWSRLDAEGEGEDSDRIEEACEWASSYIDDRLRGGKYAIPLVAISGTLHTIKDICRRLAAHWLYTSRGVTDNDEVGDRMQEHHDWAENMLNRIASGQVQIAAQTASLYGQGPAVVM